MWKEISMTWFEKLLENLKKTTKCQSEHSVLQPSSQCTPLEYKSQTLPLWDPYSVKTTLSFWIACRKQAKKFQVPYGTRSFVTVFTRTCRWNVSCARRIHRASSDTVFFPTAQQSLVGQGLLVIVASQSYSSNTPHLVGLLWTSD